MTSTASLWNVKVWTNLLDIVASEPPHAEKRRISSSKVLVSQGPRVDNDSEALHRLEGIINQLRECFVEQREARFLTGSHNSVHKVVFESILDVLSNSEIESGRFGEMSAAACSSAVVTHVDRIFGWFQQTRMRCSVCVD